MDKQTLQAIRDMFPVLDQTIYNKPLVYLDNAATTQKPCCVIERERDYYLKENCNIHRGVHYLSQVATERYENARQTVASFVNATMPSEIIFTRGTTESLNLLASSLGEMLINAGDSILVSAMEHHSNMVPWQQMAIRKGASLLVTTMDNDGVLNINHYEELLQKRPKIVSLTHISNTLGTINPIKEMTAIAHRYGALVIIDAAQSIAHHKIDVQDIGCDFLVFSGHKMYAPMGIGGLYGKMEWLEKMPPYQYGGEMVDIVTFEKTTFNRVPFKFEAGTPNVGAALGLEAAILFLNSLDRDAIEKHEAMLLNTATEKLSTIDGIQFYGKAPQRSGLVSFLIDGIHPYDLGTLVDKMGVALRTGHHCAEPVMHFYGIPGTVRASFALYNTMEEVDILVEAVQRAASMLR